MAIFTHRLALCESEHVGEGTRIWAFAHVMQGARVGADCNIGEGAFVEAGATLGDRVTVKNHSLIWNGVTIADDVFIGPAVLFTNDRRPRSPRMPAAANRYVHTTDWLAKTTVCRGASLGAGAVIVAGVTIGEFAMIGAGAVVTHDVPPHALMVGNPARPAGWVCQCGARLGLAPRCLECGCEVDLEHGEGDRHNLLTGHRKLSQSPSHAA